MNTIFFYEHDLHALSFSVISIGDVWKNQLFCDSIRTIRMRDVLALWRYECHIKRPLSQFTAARHFIAITLVIIVIFSSSLLSFGSDGIHIFRFF